MHCIHKNIGPTLYRYYLVSSTYTVSLTGRISKIKAFKNFDFFTCISYYKHSRLWWSHRWLKSIRWYSWNLKKSIQSQRKAYKMINLLTCMSYSVWHNFRNIFWSSRPYGIAEVLIRINRLWDCYSCIATPFYFCRFF